MAHDEDMYAGYDMPAFESEEWWLATPVGAALKLGTLSAVGRTPMEALALTAAMGPTAVGGAMAGAALAHRLPLRWVRLAITALLLAAAVRMAAAA